jgi:hypothetical protein
MTKLIFRSLVKKSGMPLASGSYLRRFNRLSQPLFDEQGNKHYYLKELIDWEDIGDPDYDGDRFCLYISKFPVAKLDEYEGVHEDVGKEWQSIPWQQLTDEQKIGAIVISRLWGDRYEWDDSGDDLRELLREAKKFNPDHGTPW